MRDREGSARVRASLRPQHAVDSVLADTEQSSDGASGLALVAQPMTFALSKIFLGRPRCFPSFFSLTRTGVTRSRMMLRSSSATAPRTGEHHLAHRSGCVDALIQT